MRLVAGFRRRGRYRLAGSAAVAMMVLAAIAAAGAGPAVAVPAAADAGTVARSCPPAPSGWMTCTALRRTDMGQGVFLAPGATPDGYGPADLQSAYKLPAGAGAGRTVAIVDAFDDPAAEADLAVYRAQYGLPPCTTANHCFSKLKLTGFFGAEPDPNADWSQEISLDLDMVSAACPLCNILLVESYDNSESGLLTAEDYATARAKFVSNSWDGRERDSLIDDSHFNRPGVAITVSSGDDGYDGGSQYPAASKYVTAVGGTSLTPANNARGWTESAWVGAGSGCSLYASIPSWQQGVYTGPLCSMRAVADVAAVADPNTGVAVYDSIGGTYSDGTPWSGWIVMGGTSAAAPIIAAMYALAGVPGSADYPAAYPYQRPGLFDVTTGTNGGCGFFPTCAAGTGWDAPTGLGTPNGVNALSSLAVFYNDVDATVGIPVTVTPQVSGGNAPYVAFSASGLPSGMSLDAATGAISGAPTTPGRSTVVGLVTDATGSTSAASFVIDTRTVVPDVTGMSRSGALATLAAAGLQEGNEHAIIDFTCANVGLVADQQPAAGTAVTLGSSVNLGIYTRPRPPFRCDL
jgi:Putative Ig domain/PASTA domain/Subtilase family